MRGMRIVAYRVEFRDILSVPRDAAEVRLHSPIFCGFSVFFG